MADNFSYGIKTLQKLSEIEIEANGKFENGNSDSESFNSESEEEVSEYEKQIIDHKLHLEQRLKDLQHTMVLLRKQLAEEKYMWKKQLEENIHVTTSCECQLSNTSLELEEHTGIIENGEIMEDTTLYSKELTASEYEDKLTKYQEALVKAQAEKRASLRRQISINNYKRRLLEVENMCNLELLRVRQNVQYLQPLQMMASEWYTPTNNKMIEDEEITGVQTMDSPKRDDPEIPKGVELSLIENSEKQMCNETSSMFPRMQYCNIKLPLVNSASLWQLDDDVLGIGHTTMCYSNEYLTAPTITEINPF